MLIERVAAATWAAFGRPFRCRIAEAQSITVHTLRVAATFSLSSLLLQAMLRNVIGRPNEVAAPIHDRMPVILPPDAIDLWLSPTLDPAVAVSLLEPFPAVEKEAIPVDMRVNSPRNDDAECVSPLAMRLPVGRLRPSYAGSSVIRGLLAS